MLKTLRIFFLLAILQVGAVAWSQALLDRPTRFGSPTAPNQELSPRFRVLTWNAHKGGDPKFFRDLKLLTTQTDVIALQEIVDHWEFIFKTEQASGDQRWIMARAFFNQHDGPYIGYSGVATGSRVQSLNDVVLISPVVETLLGTPKSSVISEYRIQGSHETIKVANVHAINFVLQESFELHIEQIVNELVHHQGPLVVMGDFNTWSSGRIEALGRLMKQKLGLDRVEMDNYFKYSFIPPYDHVFSRGLRVMSKKTHKEIKSSDHLPLAVEFEIVDKN